MDYEFPSELESDALPASVHRDASAVRGGSGCMRSGLVSGLHGVRCRLMSVRSRLHGVRCMVMTGLMDVVCYMSNSCMTPVAAGVEVNSATVVATSVAHVDRGTSPVVE